jgi:hypothetical protein
MVKVRLGQKKAGNLRFQRKIISHEKNYIFIFTLTRAKKVNSNKTNILPVDEANIWCLLHLS